VSILFCCPSSNAKADLAMHAHLLQHHVPRKMSSECRAPGLPACRTSGLGLPSGIEGESPPVLLFHQQRYHTNQHSSRHEQVQGNQFFYRYMQLKHSWGYFLPRQRIVSGLTVYQLRGLVVHDEEDAHHQQRGQGLA